MSSKRAFGLRGARPGPSTASSSRRDSNRGGGGGGGGGRRGGGKKPLPSLQSFDEPLHNLDYIQKTAKKSLKPVHATNPKSPLANFCNLALGTGVEYKLEEGLVGDKKVWRYVGIEPFRFGRAHMCHQGDCIYRVPRANHTGLWRLANEQEGR
jgi:hypothetical protein